MPRSSPNEAAELIYKLVRLNSPYVVERHPGMADPLPSLDASAPKPWPHGPRNVFFGDEPAPQPTGAAWATLAVRHTEREAISMRLPTFEVRGNVQVTVYTPLDRQSAEAYGFELASLVATVLDPNPSNPPRFSDGTPLFLLGSRTEALPLAQLGKWHRFAVEAPFRYEDRGLAD